MFKHQLNRWTAAALNYSDRFADTVIALLTVQAQKPYAKRLLRPLMPYYNRIKAKTDSSIKTTLIVSTFASIVMAFLLVFLIVVINLSGLVANFMDLSRQRSNEVVAEVKENSQGFQDKIRNFYADSLRRKGSTLMDKDYLVIKPPFLENSFNTVRNFLLKTLELDDEILYTSFFALEGGAVKAWVVADRQHPQGFGGLKISYDLATKEWKSEVDGKELKLSDSQITRIIGTTEKTIQLIDYDLITPDGKSRSVKAYDCTIPIFDGSPDEIKDLIAEAAPIGFLRYVITLEKMQSAIASEEKLMTAAVAKQERDAEEAQHKTQRIGTLAKFTSLFILTISGCFVLLFSVVVTRKIATKVAQPIVDLIKSARTIAAGSYDDKDAKVDLSRKDEVGSLAQSFDTMRQAIDRKIKDLNKLNHVGEMLSIQNQRSVVLDTALQAVAERFGFETGAMVTPAANEATSPWNIDHTYGAECIASALPAAEHLAQIKVGGRPIFVPPQTSTPTGGQGTDSLLYVPLMDGKEVSGVMSFTSTKAVNFSKEDESFVETIARLTGARIYNLKMMEVIEEYNRTLEQKVKERTEQLRIKTNDINAMLQNMKQGIFTVYRTRLIHPEYSAYLETLLETKDIAERDVIQVLFGHSSFGEDIRHQITAAIDSMIGEDCLSFSLNSELLPTSCEMTLDGKLKIMEMDWNPILNGEIIEKIIVTVRDVTELRKLQAESQHQKQELEMIGEILAVSRKDFSQFTQGARRFIDENGTLIKEVKEVNIDVINTMFRNMHTVKGNARTLGFKRVAEAAHHAEQTYDSLRVHRSLQWDKDTLLSELGQVREVVEKYCGINEVKLMNVTDTSDGIILDKTLFHVAAEAVKSLQLDKAHKAYQAIDLVKAAFESAGTLSVDETLRGILKAMPALANELNKAVPKIEVIDNNVRICEEHQELLRNVFAHTLRNAMDHGIETPAERSVAEKENRGRIRIEFTKHHDQIMIIQEDDGRGLDLVRIQAKALEKGLIKEGQKLSPHEIANLSFAPGLSTKENVSQISGRGVGMNAIKDYLEKSGGTAEIMLADHQGEVSGPIAFKLKMTYKLPPQCILPVLKKADETKKVA